MYSVYIVYIVHCLYTYVCIVYIYIDSVYTMFLLFWALYMHTLLYTYTLKYTHINGMWYTTHTYPYTHIYTHTYIDGYAPPGRCDQSRCVRTPLSLCRSHIGEWCMHVYIITIYIYTNIHIYTNTHIYMHTNTPITLTVYGCRSC